MNMFQSINVVVKKSILVVLILSLIQVPAFATEPTRTANSPAIGDLTNALLQSAGRAEVRNIRFGFKNPEKYFTNSIDVFPVADFFEKKLEQIPDEVVAATESFLEKQVQLGHIKSFEIKDIGGTDILVHVTHNFGERNASVVRIMLEAIQAGLLSQADQLKVSARNMSINDIVSKLNPKSNNDSKVERGAESVMIAIGVGVTIGAANIKLFHQFAIPGSTPLQKLGLEKSPGFRFRVKRMADILAGKTDGPEWEFEISVDQRDKDQNIVRAGKNEGVQLLALASQPNDYQITAVYPVENIVKGTAPSHEPAATVVYQTVNGTNGKAIMNPIIIYRSQSGFDAVGGIANMVYDPNFVPGGEKGDQYVVTTPATLEEARKAPPKGFGFFATYAYQSRNDGEIPTEGVRDHVGMNYAAYNAHRRVAASLAAVMSDHDDDQPFLSPGASEHLVEPIRDQQDDLFTTSPKDSEPDRFLENVNAKITSGEFVNVTDDKADMGGRVGHTNVPEMLIAIYRASLMEAIEQGIIQDGNTIGFAGDHARVQDLENVGVGDDGHLLMLGDKSINGAEAHQLSFLAFTRAYLFSVVNGKKYYGTGQDFQGPEAKAAKENPFFYSRLTPRFFELLEQVMPQNEIKLGVIGKVKESWQEWEQGDKSVTLTEPFSGNVSQQGIGSARYSFNPKVERTFDVIAGDKMGPAALNRLIKHMAFNAITKGEFPSGLVFEIWDLKAFDREGNIAFKDFPSSADIATLGYKSEADAEFVYNAYENGGLKPSIGEAEKQRLAEILKRSGFVPSKRIFLDAVKDREAVIRYLADSDRFNVKHVWSKSSDGWDINNPGAFLDRPMLGASVTRLGILTGGEYVGKDDPVIVGNSKLLKYGHEFLRTRPLIVQGDMNGSHWEQAVPTALKNAVATVRSHPIFVSLRYTVSRNGKTLTKVEDISGRKTFDKARDNAHDFNFDFDKAQLGQFEPHGTNARTVEGSYELAKILRKLNQADSPFLLANKKAEAQRADVDRTFPDATANHLRELFEAAVSIRTSFDSTRAEVREDGIVNGQLENLQIWKTEVVYNHPFKNHFRTDNPQAVKALESELASYLFRKQLQHHAFFIGVLQGQVVTKGKPIPDTTRIQWTILEKKRSREELVDQARALIANSIPQNSPGTISLVEGTFTLSPEYEKTQPLRPKGFVGFTRVAYPMLLLAFQPDQGPDEIGSPVRAEVRTVIFKKFQAYLQENGLEARPYEFFPNYILISEKKNYMDIIQDLKIRDLHGQWGLEFVEWRGLISREALFRDTQGDIYESLSRAEVRNDKQLEELVSQAQTLQDQIRVHNTNIASELAKPEPQRDTKAIVQNREAIAGPRSALAAIQGEIKILESARQSTDLTRKETGSLIPGVIPESHEPEFVDWLALGKELPTIDRAEARVTTAEELITPLKAETKAAIEGILTAVAQVVKEEEGRLVNRVVGAQALSSEKGTVLDVDLLMKGHDGKSYLPFALAFREFAGKSPVAVPVPLPNETAESKVEYLATIRVLGEVNAFLTAQGKEKFEVVDTVDQAIEFLKASLRKQNKKVELQAVIGVNSVVADRIKKEIPTSQIITPNRLASLFSMDSRLAQYAQELVRYYEIAKSA